ncbi:hypothetical protein [Methanobrevibacter arboriphilus]|uniref:hypothetical protein n=1 Tax=Methanobrevibacter arboriphilus TaxID=39441 RepID=UPI000AA97236|nr:hypothetical protein [Methanobrevibacter arboriphilus]
MKQVEQQEHQNHFLTENDWEKYIEKYARTFKSQGFKSNDYLIVCTSYGMNIGAESMSLAAKKLKITTIPEGKCTFPIRILKNYKPTSIVGSIFKFLRLAERMKENKLDPPRIKYKTLNCRWRKFFRRITRIYRRNLGC